LLPKKKAVSDFRRKTGYSGRLPSKGDSVTADDRVAPIVDKREVEIPVAGN